ncbi:golgin subfamily A member 6-like protein 26 [Palaemon carinicauda]|uniref:golgin subfamily A member 6-like protein 26 n=1 Tax=Palaemon carinicauda TaxID=392227 RepID=UPI0035B68B9A
MKAFMDTISSKLHGSEGLSNIGTGVEVEAGAWIEKTEQTLARRPEIDCMNCIIDGNAILQAQVALPTSFGELAEKVFDQLPKWKQDKYANKLKNRVIYFVNGRNCAAITSTDGLQTETYEVEALQSSQKEADSRIILHLHHMASQVSEDFTIVIRSPDTDVFILLLKFAQVLKQTILFDTGVGDKRRLIDVHKVVDKTGKELCEVLPSLHAYSGCDSLQDLQLTNERIKSELSNKEIAIGDQLDKLTEKDQKILGLTQQLEKVQEENEARIKRENKLEKESEELKAETQGLSNRIETLQKEKEIVIEKFLIKLQHLQKSSDRLKEELSNKDASIGQYLNRLSEMGQISLEMRNYTCLVNELKDTKKEARRAKDEPSRASGEIGKLKKSMASIAKERDNLKERVCHLRSGERMAEDRIVQTTKENVGLKDELLAANVIISSLEEQLEGRDKKKEVSRPGTRKVRLNRSSLEISTEKDVKKDGQKAVQKDVSVNKEDENKVGKAAEDLDSNGHKGEKEVVGEASSVGQVLSCLLASKGALPDNDDHQKEQKLQKETSPSEEEEEKEEEEKEEEEEEEEKGAKEKEKNEKEEEEIAEKKPARKPIVFDLEPEKPKRVFSSHITFQGAKVGANTTRDHDLKGHVSADLDVPRKFHRAIYGVEGRTLREITRQSGVSSIDMPRRHQFSHSITISGTIGQVQLAADHIDRLLRRLTGK